MKMFSIDREYCIIFSGITLSLIVNFLFYINDSARAVGKLQYAICILLPCLIALILALITITIRAILRGQKLFKTGCREYSKDILAKNNSIFLKILARTYLILVYPGIFWGAWLIGCILFGALTTDIEKFIFAVPILILVYFLSKILTKKYPQN